MSARISTLLFCLSFVTALASAQDEVFLSLTRQAEPLKDLPTNVSVITAQQIKEKGARDLGEVLDQEVGLNRSKNGSLGQLSTLSIRGATTAETLILIDGRRVDDFSLGTVNLSSIPTDSIERIEIIRGAASSLYGANAFGGVVNIITRRPRENMPLISVDGSVGSFNTQNYHLNFGIRRNDTYGMVTAGKNASKGWRDNSDLDNRDLFVRLGYDAKEAGQFDFSGSLYDGGLGVPGTGVSLDRYDGTSEKAASTPLTRQTERSRYARVEYGKAWTVNALKARVYSSNNVRTYDSPEWFTHEKYDSFSYGGELQFSTRYNVTMGGEAWQETFRQSDTSLNVETINRSRVNSALYLLQKTVLGQVTLLPSARYDNNSVFGSVVSPRLTVVYAPSALLKFSGNTGKSWRAPTFTDLYGFGGDPALKPEEGITSDIGAEYTLPAGAVSLTGFLTDTSNLIQWNSATSKVENIGRTRQTGVELGYRQKLMSGVFNNLNYTYLWAVDRSSDRVLNYRPMHTINEELTCMTPFGMRISAGAQYVSSQQTWDSWAPIVSELPSYVLVHAGIQQKIGDFELWARADNLLNEKYQTRLEYPLPGLTVQTGLTLRFWE